MNYTNYECNIVERCGIALIDWPLSGPVCNPSKAGGRTKLSKLSDALKAHTCHWVILTDEERASRMKENHICHARGEGIYVARKRRGAAASKYKSSDVVVATSEEESEGSDTSDSSADE